MEDPPFANIRWAIDNWFMSKPLYDKLLRLRQYLYGTMELKRYVPPFVTFGGTNKPTNATPKDHLEKRVLLIVSYHTGPTWTALLCLSWILAREDRWNQLFA
eukprot:2539433-Ditylum_brightwellii.AAC.1